MCQPHFQRYFCSFFSWQFCISCTIIYMAWYDSQKLALFSAGGFRFILDSNMLNPKSFTNSSPISAMLICPLNPKFRWFKIILLGISFLNSAGGTCILSVQELETSYFKAWTFLPGPELWVHAWKTWELNLAARTSCSSLTEWQGQTSLSCRVTSLYKPCSFTKHHYTYRWVQFIRTTTIK